MPAIAHWFRSSSSFSAVKHPRSLRSRLTQEPASTMDPVSRLLESSLKPFVISYDHHCSSNNFELSPSGIEMKLNLVSENVINAFSLRRPQNIPPKTSIWSDRTEIRHATSCILNGPQCYPGFKKRHFGIVCSVIYVWQLFTRWLATFRRINCSGAFRIPE